MDIKEVVADKITTTNVGTAIANTHPITTALGGPLMNLFAKKVRTVGKEAGIVEPRDSIVEKVIEENLSKFGIMSKSKYGYASSEVVGDVVSIIFFVLAIFFLMRCRKLGHTTIMEIFVAICCAPFYVIYRLIRPCS
jgi:hypothetical protein